MRVRIDKHPARGLFHIQFQGDAQQLACRLRGQLRSIGEAGGRAEDEHRPVAHQLPAHKLSAFRGESEKVGQQVGAVLREVIALQVAQQVNPVRQARKSQLVRPLPEHGQVLEAAREILFQGALIVNYHGDRVLGFPVGPAQHVTPYGHLFGDEPHDRLIVEETPSHIHPVWEEGAAGTDREVAQQPPPALVHRAPRALRGAFAAGPTASVVLHQDRLAAQHKRVPDPLRLIPKAYRPRRVVCGRDEHVELRQIQKPADADGAGAQEHVGELHPESRSAEGVFKQPSEHGLLQGVNAHQDGPVRRLPDGCKHRPVMLEQQFLLQPEVVPVAAGQRRVRPVHP